jgi:hypothetical protein
MFSILEVLMIFMMPVMVGLMVAVHAWAPSHANRDVRCSGQPTDTSHQREVVGRSFQTEEREQFAFAKLIQRREARARLHERGDRWVSFMLPRGLPREHPATRSATRKLRESEASGRTGTDDRIYGSPNSF